MQFTKPNLILFSGAMLAALLFATGNPAMGQAYDPSDWYGNSEGYLNDYDDDRDYFYDGIRSARDGDGYNDDYYDNDEIGSDYRSRYFPNRNDNDLTRDYDSRYFPSANKSDVEDHIDPRYFLDDDFGPTYLGDRYDDGAGNYGYSRHRIYPGGAYYSGGSRYYGPHWRIHGYDGLYERPYGFNNYYYDDSNLDTRGTDYFTNDWYDANAGFDGWY